MLRREYSPCKVHTLTLNQLGKLHSRKPDLIGEAFQSKEIGKIGIPTMSGIDYRIKDVGLLLMFGLLCFKSLAMLVVLIRFFISPVIIVLFFI